MFCATLAVTRTKKEVSSKNKEKAEEETIPTKCNISLHHSYFNKSAGEKHNHYFETKQQTEAKRPKAEDFATSNSATVTNFTTGDQAYSDSEGILHF